MPATPASTQQLGNALGYDLSQLPVTVTGAATIYSGSGTASASLGKDGDWYLRTDTPGTLAQRIYIKSGGSWVNALA